jgi:hypothetical protein
MDLHPATARSHQAAGADTSFQLFSKASMVPLPNYSFHFGYYCIAAIADPVSAFTGTPSSQQHSSKPPQQEQQQSSSARSAPQASSAPPGASQAAASYARQLHTALLQAIVSSCT